MNIHRAGSRGQAEHGWLSSRHTFSFAGYYDSTRMGFGPLRVLNDDTVQPGKGFDTHPHRDMEIISIPLSGALSHRDSQGHETVIGEGEIQVMSAGTGILHSEYNASNTEEVHFLQIWVLPRERGGQPRYDQGVFPGNEQRNRWRMIISPDGRDGSLTIGQDATFFQAALDEGQNLMYSPGKGRGLYLFIKSGRIQVDDLELHPGDGLAVEETSNLALEARRESEILLMDLPMIPQGGQE